MKTQKDFISSHQNEQELQLQKKRLHIILQLRKETKKNIKESKQKLDKLTNNLTKLQEANRKLEEFHMQKKVNQANQIQKNAERLAEKFLKETENIEENSDAINQINSIREEIGSSKEQIDKITEEYSRQNEENKEMTLEIEKLEKQIIALHQSQAFLLRSISIMDDQYATVEMQLKNILNAYQLALNYVRPMIRIRKELDIEQQQRCVKYMNNSNLQLESQSDKYDGKKDIKYTQYTFYKVFSENQTQQDLYKEVKPFALSLLQGKSFVLLCFGQSGSGKTYTVLGNIKRRKKALTSADIEEAQSQWGLLLRTLNSINVQLKQTKNQYKDVEIQLKVIQFSPPIGPQEKKIIFSQIYSQQLFEKDYFEIVVTVLGKIQDDRPRRETKMNKQSSRSHLCIEIDIKGIICYPNKEQVFNGRGFFFDFAGNQRLQTNRLTGAEQSLETKYINSTLLQLYDAVLKKQKGKSELSRYIVEILKQQYPKQQLRKQQTMTLIFGNISSKRRNAIAIKLTLESINTYMQLCSVKEEK